jgi:arylsulfatase A-like enzyme
MTQTEKLTGPEYQDAPDRGAPDHRASGPQAQPAGTPERPYNIIIINADTYRYDNLFDRAAIPVATPNLDAFAARAVEMDAFYTGSFPTIPERTDLISGRYAWPWYPWQYLDEENRMPQLLNSQGYVTQLICDCPHLFNAGFNRTFNAAYQVRGQEGDIAFLHMNDPIQPVMDRDKTRTGYHFQDRNLVDLHRWSNRYWTCEDETFPPRTAGHAVRWLEENYEFRPFLLWVDFFDPHEPWDPPEYMIKKYDPDYTGMPVLHPNYGHASDYTPAELRNLRAHYCAEAELVDRWVGRIIQKLDDLDLWSSTIVIFTTDHGMSLGEHDRTGKSNINDRDDRRWPLYPEIAHIPFLIAGPGLAGGTAVKHLAQPVDVLPTLLELNGLEVEVAAPFHGQSFAASLRGTDQAPLHKNVVCGCYLRNAEGEATIADTASTPVIYYETWAYAPFGPDGEPELFNLEDDPYAETNVIDEHPEVAQQLHADLIAWLREIDAPEEAIAVYLT